MKVDVEAYQTHWHPEEIFESFPSTLDTYVLFQRWDAHVRRSASAGKAGRVLDVACGDARDLSALNFWDWEGWGIDPSPLQLRDARRSAQKEGQRINLVQGVAEWLPFKEGVFDSLICKSALDHFVDREAAVSDFARVLAPTGRAVVSVNNYRSFSTRFSRLLYRVIRAVWPPARRTIFFWDSPVTYGQHTYEYTYENTRTLGEPYFDEMECYGVSFLWAFPGWGRFLSFLPDRISGNILKGLDKLARSLPRFADVVVFVWRPKAGREGSGGAQGQS